MTLSEAMRRLRLWFDHHGIQTKSFIIKSSGDGFEIGFSSERDAALFSSFGWDTPPG